MIKHYLKTHNMTQKQFSHIYGIPQSTLSYIQTGKTKSGKTYDKVINIIKTSNKKEKMLRIYIMILMLTFLFTIIFQICKYDAWINFGDMIYEFYSFI